MIVCFAAMLINLSHVSAQQQTNPDFKPKPIKPAFESGTGPRVVIDEAHSNFHTRTGRYKPFSIVAEADGFQISSNEKLFSAESLAECDILVIANPLHESNRSSWKLPTPSAFSDEEIKALTDWISKGGSLFLIADHMPFPGATEKLAEKLGIEMSNGFAFRKDPNDEKAYRSGALIFKKENELIGDHIITKGFRESESVQQVASFTGQAFRTKREDVSVLLRLPNDMVSLEPEQAWMFSDETKRVDVSGWSQGVAFEHGEGKVVVFGEAAMFSSQVNPQRGSSNGMSQAAAKDNEQLLRNILRWLGDFEE